MAKDRHLIIDTDTGSDDVWAIVEALRAVNEVCVEAITVVCGNLPLDLCVKNAMLAEDAAGTVCPPVYRGMERPLMSEKAFYAFDVHGDDGLGGLHLSPSPRPVEKKHAVDALIELVMTHPGQMEIATLGPLTNIAMAVLKEPHFAGNVKKIWVLGGSAGGFGNATPAAEYNIFVDPEAASIVLEAGMDSTWITWDTSRGDTEITAAEREKMLKSKDPAAVFCARSSASLLDYNRRVYGKDSMGVIDSLLMTAALYPEVMRSVFSSNCAVETQQGECRGYFRIDRQGKLKKEPNCKVCPKIDAYAYKHHLFSLLGVKSLCQDEVDG